MISFSEKICVQKNDSIRGKNSVHKKKRFVPRKKFCARKKNRFVREKFCAQKKRFVRGKNLHEKSSLPFVPF
jgi:hypothetical protein